MKPWTPRNGTDAHLIFGTWMTRNLRPLVFSVSEFHGPVIQKAAFLLRNAVCAALESTFALIRPSRFHLSISDAFLRNFAFATPSFCGLRLPALLTPKT
jgi:hypothetical protein